MLAKYSMQPPKCSHVWSSWLSAKNRRSVFPFVQDYQQSAFFSFLFPYFFARHSCAMIGYIHQIELYRIGYIHQIELVQHRAARLVFRDYLNFSHVTPMLKQPGWDTLEQRTLSYRLSMFYKIRFSWYLPSIWSIFTNKGFLNPQWIPFPPFKSHTNWMEKCTTSQSRRAWWIWKVRNILEAFFHKRSLFFHTW